MNEKYLLLLRKLILQSLSECGDNLYPENTLYADVCMSLPIAATLNEFKHEVRYLEAEGYIAGINPSGIEAGSPRKWKLTDLGRLEL
jgi:hypothetical protein